MSQLGGSFGIGAADADAPDELTAQVPVAVYTCNRLGRVANPPGFSVVDWFRSARRR
ncbi:hypothetical protein MCEL_00730 [Mycolicibacterium celeriflavum]|uniref:Uncharacterized protein n=1 Tax=Mycolicibacterium celeriflavum TaxID=1249101 RepID=A0A7I7RB62_MYCCF|nr:hypothetical protein MCEL_00730 [Mycolicibacterium celeriflavum]